MPRLRSLVMTAALTVLAAAATAVPASAAYENAGQFGGVGTGNGQFGSATWAAVDPNTSDVYVVDAGNNYRVEKFDSNGNYLSQFGGFGGIGGTFHDPVGVTVNPSNGDVYVVDDNADGGRIVRFDSAGNYLSSWNVGVPFPNELPGDPVAIAFDPNNNLLYVTYAMFSQGAVTVFDTSGNHQFSFNAVAGSATLDYPQGIAIDPSTGFVYVADGATDVVDRFDQSGDYLGDFGSQGTGNGQFSNDGATVPSGPAGVAVDPNSDHVFVVDNGGNRVEEFDATGTYVGKFGSTGTGLGQFQAPLGVAVDPDSRTVYTTDTNAGNDRVEMTAQVAPGNAAAPLISGIAQDGQVLTTTNGTWSSPDTLTYTYAWQRCTGALCVPIPGATLKSYKLSFADVGHTISVIVTATDREGLAAQSEATPIGSIAKPPTPSPTGSPVISGLAQVGQLLKTSNGRWSSPDKLTFKYQWLSCNPVTGGCTPILRATASSYRVPSTLVGSNIDVRVTATDAEGQSGQAFAPRVGAVTPS